MSCGLASRGMKAGALLAGSGSAVEDIVVSMAGVVSQSSSLVDRIRGGGLRLKASDIEVREVGANNQSFTSEYGVILVQVVSSKAARQQNDVTPPPDVYE